ncbi:MAG: mechanosensitive ion channel family protein [Pseudomonadota bacterium]
MDALIAALDRLAAFLARPATFAQLATVLVAVLAALQAARLARLRRAELGDAAATAPPATRATAGASRALLAEALRVALPYAVALLVLLVSRAALGLAGLDTALLDQCLVLLGALIAIRGLVFGLRVSLGPASALRAWEVRAALVIWFFVAMQLLGWLQAFIEVLDSVAVTPAAKGEAPLTLWSIIRTLFTIVAFVIVSAWIGRWLERRVQGVQGLAASTRIAVSKFTYAFLIGLGILLGLRASGLDLGALGIFGGALGLGLGFGLQAIAANFVSGFVLLMDRSIKPGDVISFTGTTGTSTEGFGWVQELRGRYVVVRDRDGVETLVPNQNLITNQVINWSYSDRRVRLKLPVRISYDDDPEHALRVLLTAADCSRRILKEPPPVARLMGFQDYGMELELRFWIADPEAGVNNVRSDVNRAIWRVFKEAGITIPRAQLDVRMIDADGHIVGEGKLPARRVPREKAPPVPPPGQVQSESAPPARPFGL